MRLGITGHQKLSAEVRAWVYEELQRRILGYADPVVGNTSLAVGADQIFAKAVLACGGRLHAVLPFADIERSFEPKDVPAYRKLLAHASIEVLDISGTDEDSYLAAGERVVDLSDVVFAVWNGLPAKGKGGTADVVRYAARQQTPVIHLNTTTFLVAAV